MKKVLFGFLFLFISSVPLFAAPTFTESCTLDATTTTCSFPSLRDETNLGISFHKISVVIVGSNTGSSALLQYNDSPNSTTFSTLITLSSIASGSSVITAGTHGRWQLALSNFTPTSVGAKVTITHSAYADNDATTGSSSDISTVGGAAVATCNTTVPCVPVQLFDSNGHIVAYNDVVTVIVAPFTPILVDAISSTAKTVYASPGTLGPYYCYNPNAVVTYLQLLDATSPTVGSTVPVASLGLPPGAGGNVIFNWSFANAIKVAATTTVKNSTAPSTAIDCSFGYR